MRGYLPKAKIKSMINDLKSACYVGEDGNMATICKTKRGAWVKFRKQVREDYGFVEADEIEITDIEVGYAYLATPEEIERDNGEHEWYVDTDKKLGSVKVWHYSPF